MDKEYDVFADFKGTLHMKVKAGSYKEAVEKAEMEVNGYSIDPYVNIKTMDGETYEIYVDDVDVEYAQENPDEFDESDQETAQ